MCTQHGQSLRLDACRDISPPYRDLRQMLLINRGTFPRNRAPQAIRRFQPNISPKVASPGMERRWGVVQEVGEGALQRLCQRQHPVTSELQRIVQPRLPGTVIHGGLLLCWECRAEAGQRKRATNNSNGSSEVSGAHILRAHAPRRITVTRNPPPRNRTRECRRDKLGEVELTFRMMPKSPWSASIGFRNVVRSPREFMLATNLSPIFPLFPTPMTMVFPPLSWLSAIASTARTNPSRQSGSVAYRRDRWNRAWASVARTCVAVRSILCGSAASWLTLWSTSDSGSAGGVTG